MENGAECGENALSPQIKHSLECTSNRSQSTMCGIVAYIGHREATPILLEGLKRLEYRGYDSAGVAVLRDDRDESEALDLVKSVGRVRVLEDAITEHGGLPGSIGIAHTRWATHGGVTEANAHPHRD
ncbi:MAG: hypothetical protein GY871_15205, partial [Actinomycetales bacterium]|nr:hypothetical protein [Actinomycetales bacterium]